jgi:hypothetical protein
MLNRNGKGTVYFGVDDNGKVNKKITVGKNTFSDIRNRSREMIDPQVVLKIEEHKSEEGNTYISVYANGHDIPYSFDGKFYIRTGDADEILDGLVSELSGAGESEKFDFVFIDAAKSHYKEFFEAAEKICTEDALIVCDNILLSGWIVEAEGKDAKRHRTSIKYMKKFLEGIRQRDDLEVTLLTGADGLAIIRFIHE